MASYDESPTVGWTCHTPPRIHITLDCLPHSDALRQQRREQDGASSLSSNERRQDYDPAPTPGPGPEASPLDTMLGGLVAHADVGSFLPHDEKMLSVSPAAYGCHAHSLSRDDLAALMAVGNSSSASVSALAT